MDIGDSAVIQGDCDAISRERIQASKLHHNRTAVCATNRHLMHLWRCHTPCFMQEHSH